MKNIQLVTALAIALSANAVSYAGTYKISANVNVLSSPSTYDVRDTGSNLYAQVSGLKKTATVITGEGVFAAINKNETKEDSSVIGIDMNGQSELSLERLSDSQVLVNVNLVVDDVVEGQQVYFESKYQAIAQFTKGSWTAYKAGKKIELQFTQEGQEMATDAIAKNLKKMLGNIKDLFSAQHSASGAQFSALTLDNMDVQGLTVIKGDSNRLEVVGAPTNMVMGFKVKANF